MRGSVNTGANELFQILRDGRPRTRSELVRLTGLSRSTVGLRTDELLETGLIAPVADAASTGGRPSARVALNPSARIIVAADLGAVHATVAITDLSAKVLSESRTEIDIAAGPETVLSWLIATVDDLIAKLRRSTEEIAAFGIGLPGPVEYGSGRPSNPPIMPGWDNYDVPARIRESYNVPVLVDNDVNIMALGERAVGWPDVDDLIFLKVATGIGAGIISGGALQRGAKGIAGDVGHIPVTRATGVACVCGNLGCLEAIAGSPAILAELQSSELEIATISDIMRSVQQGNWTAIQTIRQAGRDIGEMLNMCVTIVNPSVIVIGGSMAQAGEHLLAGIRETVYSRSMPLATQHLTIAPTRTGTESAVIGASLMAIEHTLSPEHLQRLANGQPMDAESA